jgi:DNA-binding NarL/FixJ family response regulator
MSKNAKIALVDDHVLLRRALANLVRNLGYEVVLESDNGKKFIDALNPVILPDLVLLDINMPEMDGYKTALWLKQAYPKIRVLVLSMYDNENAVIGMLKCGARGYVLKDTEPAVLQEAIEEVLDKGFYHSEFFREGSVSPDDEPKPPVTDFSGYATLTAKETEFLRQVCSELTYKEIAARMDLSPRTVDSYRDILFEKLKIKSRVGLVLFAIKHGIVKI